MWGERERTKNDEEGEKHSHNTQATHVPMTTDQNLMYLYITQHGITLGHRAFIF